MLALSASLCWPVASNASPCCADHVPVHAHQPRHRVLDLEVVSCLSLRVSRVPIILFPSLSQRLLLQLGGNALLFQVIGAVPDDRCCSK